MSSSDRQFAARRRFLRWLASTPALPALSWAASSQRDPDSLPESVLQSIGQYDQQIATAKDATSVFDLEAVARRKLHVGHLAYLAASEDQGVARNNREGFARFQVRAQRLTGVAKADTSVSLLGTRWDAPILLCPAGRQGAFAPDAEVAVARAARSRKHLQVLSNAASRSIEDVTVARGQPLWFQLYPDSDWNKTRAMILSLIHI